MYLISVYFDDKSNKIISNYINKIAQKTGNTFMTDNHVPPHLTIMSVEAREEKKLTEVMEQLERSLTKGQIQLVSVGVLLPYVLYAAPVLNLYLEDMIEQVHDMVKHIPEVRMSRYYQPMQWLPHITLGKKLSKEQNNDLSQWAESFAYLARTYGRDSDETFKWFKYYFREGLIPANVALPLVVQIYLDSSVDGGFVNTFARAFKQEPEEDKKQRIKGMKKELAEEILSGDEIKTASFQREELLELLEERF